MEVLCNGSYWTQIPNDRVNDIFPSSSTMVAFIAKKATNATGQTPLTSTYSQALVNIYQHITIWSPEEYLASCNSAVACFASMHRARRLDIPTYRPRPGGIECPLGLVSQHSITHKSMGKQDLASTHVSTRRHPSTFILAQNRTSLQSTHRRLGVAVSGKIVGKLAVSCTFPNVVVYSLPGPGTHWTDHKLFVRV